MLHFDRKSALLCPAAASCKFAPIDVPGSRIWLHKGSAGPGLFAKYFLLGKGPEGSKTIDPVRGAAQADINYEYKEALARATAREHAERVISRMVAGGTDVTEELAVKIGVPPRTLREIIERYNRDVAAGKDTEFGRVTLAGGTGRTVRIETTPFYAYASRAQLPATYGGIVVDENMRVLNRQGAIPGLFAAGEIVGGFHGAGYMSGTGVAKAVIFGRIAGRNAAANLR